MSFRLEQIPVLAHIALGGEVKWCEFFQLIVPNVDLQHDVLVFTDLLDVTQDVACVTFVVLFLCQIISVLVLLVINFWLILIPVIILETFSGFIKAFEEVHHVPESNIDLKFIDGFEDLSGLNLGIDIE